MTRLPFEIFLLLPDRPCSGRVRIELTPLTEEDDEPADASTYSGARSVLALFGAAVNAQMFRNLESGTAAWQAGECMVMDRGASLQLDVHVDRLPLYAWAHLLALLRKNHDALEPLQCVRIEAMAEASPQDIQTLVKLVPQHLRQGKPGFEWTTAAVGQSRNLHLDIEFRDQVRPEVRERVEGDLAIWLQLNILGAFDLDFAEADDLDPLGTVTTTSPYRIECFVPYYTGDMSGFVALENWLCNLHQHHQSLEEASLE